MPLSDYFRDPYVQAGVISRPQNWQMRLGSLSAALGNMDRGGMLGQSLAQAGAIYQDQRQGALAAAMERAQQEAKAAREAELFAMQRERFDAERADREIQEEERRVKVEQEVVGREAMRRRLDDLGLPMQYADSPEMARAAINEAEMSLRPKKPDTAGYSAVPESGRVYRTNPETGEPEIHNFGAAPNAGGSAGKLSPAYVEALIQQYPEHAAIIRANPESFATQAAQSVFDKPAAVKADTSHKDIEKLIDDVRADDAWAESFETMQGRPPDYGDLVGEAIKRRDIVNRLLTPAPFASVLGGQSHRPTFSKERVQELRGGTKPIKPKGGETVAGSTLASPKASSLATGKMGLLRGVPKKSEEQAIGLARLESAVEKAKTILPPEQAAALGPVIKQMTDSGMDPEEIADFLEQQVRTLLGSH